MEMERQVEDLTRQVAALQAVEGKNVALSRRNEYLERLVKIQIEEIKNLKREIALQASELEHTGTARWRVVAANACREGRVAGGCRGPSRLATGGTGLLDAR